MLCTDIQYMYSKLEQVSLDCEQSLSFFIFSEGSASTCQPPSAGTFGHLHVLHEKRETAGSLE